MSRLKFRYNSRPWRPASGRIARLVAVVLLAGCALLAVPVSPASAQPCPDAEVVFARGTGEPPGVGGIGQSFVDTLRSKTGAKSVAVYPVNYAASADFADNIQFALTVIDGIRDATNHIQSVASSCPGTKIVLGGYSQGAALAGFVTSADVPPGIPAAFVPPPMPPEVAAHVAAVTLFGKPSNKFLSDSGAPTVVIGPLYVPKTIDLCAPGDTICNGAPPGPPRAAHGAYGTDGLVNQAATFSASRI
ncbi:cutinase family protein [Mycobacterium sp. OTB74]|uniref:cutinase family protein n=1 Tax=Mycobacterium sp. OTB74 TaxID=1853452 RepID=UPI0024764F31|nr:cutinase family protein [Mycobacterium sp. OTB74]